MAVIALPSIVPQGSSVTDDWELRSITQPRFSPLNGVATTLERPGARWAVTPRWHNLNGSGRARMQQHLANCRGHASRMYVPLYGWTRRGSFSAPELLTNNTFASGTTGWTAGNCTLTAQDGLLRMTVTSPLANVSIFQSVALTQYAPHALRSLLIDGPQTSGLTIGRAINDSVSAQVSDYGTSRGLGTVVLVPEGGGASNQFAAVFGSTTGYTAGAYLTIGYTSLARCALVDNGPNEGQRSDEIDNAYWTKDQVTASANFQTAPDGTTTAEKIIENTANNFHIVLRTDTRSNPGAAADYCAYGYFKRSAGTRDMRLILGSDTTNYVHAYFRIGAGTVDNVSAAGTATNPRAFIVSAGDGWYFCAIVGRLAAGTGIEREYVFLNPAGDLSTYTGDGTSAIAMWRLGWARSSVPTRGMQTTSAGDSDGTLQTGSALYLKGLPASTNGLLLQGDPVEIVTNTSTQLVRASSALNSDAAGLGYFEFEAPIRISPLDNAAVIINNPLCRMMLDDNTVRWSEHDGTFCDVEFTAVEDTYP